MARTLSIRSIIRRGEEARRGEEEPRSEEELRDEELRSELL
jgi:hypothetical protein